MSLEDGIISCWLYWFHYYVSGANNNLDEIDLLYYPKKIWFGDICFLNAAEKGLEKCRQGCGGKQIDPGFKNSTYDFDKKKLYQDTLSIVILFAAWCFERSAKLVRMIAQ